jgi:DeoR/GlpR family transcriptional regulator of sugar metabolism
MSSINVHNQAALLKEERQLLVLEALRAEGKVLASELSARLNVSEDTIRRDLRELAREQKIQRVHGGALPRSPAAATYTSRRKQAGEAKLAIAKTAARLIQDRQLVFMDGGTTTLQVAYQLPPSLHATIVTNSPPIAVALAEHPNVEVVLLGGRLYKSAQVTIGAATVEELHSFRADLCLLGVCSLHPEVGLSIPDFEEAHIKRAMIACSAEVAGLVVADKLGTAHSFVVGPAKALTYLVTDAAAPEEKLDPYRALGITILKAPAPTNARRH